MTAEELDQVLEDPRETAEFAGLTYVNDALPGIRRLKKGRGFLYLDDEGNRVQDARTMGRIKSLVLPPATTRPGKTSGSVPTNGGICKLPDWIKWEENNTNTILNGSGSGMKPNTTGYCNSPGRCPPYASRCRKTCGSGG